MGIIMIGLDHNMAGVDIRAKFSFTRKNTGQALELLKNEAGIRGVILVSTCNRMELWVSPEEDDKTDLYEILCRLKNIPPDEDYRKYFVIRKDREAVEHLFYLTAGLKSQILGEDQILTQIKDALDASREVFAADGILEVLFRMAVTAGKRIKTEVPFAHGNPSVIHQALDMLEKDGYSVREKTIMVIGNGEMGKVAAQTLMENGGRVTVTVRQYRSGLVNIPRGCERINYGDRLLFLPSCDLVVSATASPNFTLKLEELKSAGINKDMILIDLAVPRDIDPEARGLDHITLYDMDSFRMDTPPAELTENLEKAGVIVADQMAEFYQWLDGRDLIPRIQEIKEEALKDFSLRVSKVMKKSSLDEEERESLNLAVETAVGKVVNKLIFGLRDNLNKKAFMDCVEGLEKLYEK